MDKKYIQVEDKFLHSKIYNCCGTDALRPVLECVYFHDGKAVATDAHVLMVQDLRKVHQFSDELVEMMEGKMLHSSQLKDIENCTGLRVYPDRIEGRSIKSLSKVVCEFREDGIFPDYKKVIPQGSMYIDSIGLNSKLLDRIHKSFVDPAQNGVLLEFTGHNTAAFVLNNNSHENRDEQFAIIMPVLKPRT